MSLKIEDIAAQRSFVFLWCGSCEGLDLGRQVMLFVLSVLYNIDIYINFGFPACISKATGQTKNFMDGSDECLFWQMSAFVPFTYVSYFSWLASVYV